MRIIPRKTKVKTEFFTGISFSDIVVGFIGVVLIALIITSNLPYKLAISGVIFFIFALLLIKIDEESNYVFLFRIIKYFSYHRSYKKVHKSYLIQEEITPKKHKLKHKYN